MGGRKQPDNRWSVRATSEVIMIILHPDDDVMLSYVGTLFHGIASSAIFCEYRYDTYNHVPLSRIY